MSVEQLTFDHELSKKAPDEKGAFLKKKVCLSCGRKMEVDEFRSTEDHCYWCRRLGRRKGGYDQEDRRNS